MKTIRFIFCAVLISFVLPQVLAQDIQTSDVSFDTSPGTVSATALLGISPDDITVVRNPRDFTVLIKTFRGDEAFGISVTPARTALAPLNITDYDASYRSPFGYLTRAWANLTFGYAQGQAKVENNNIDRRAVSLETSLFLDSKDDPLISYFELIKSKKEPCILIPSTQPSSPSEASDKLNEDPKLTKITAERGKVCRDLAEKDVRWNASRVWASISTGDYKSSSTGSRTSIGRTIVLGGTYGIGDINSKVTGTVSLVATRENGIPIAQSLGLQTPERGNQNLIFAQIAGGSKNFRLIVQGTNLRDKAPTLMTRSYKRALGIDWRVREGMWLMLRSGSQKKVDNTGNESSSSFTLNFSPTMDLKLF